MFEGIAIGMFFIILVVLFLAVAVGVGLVQLLVALIKILFVFIGKLLLVVAAIWCSVIVVKFIISKVKKNSRY